MIIGIIGSGGREHSICSSLNKSKIVKKIFCFPGNAGTENIATNIKINLNNFNELKNFIFKEKIKMIVVGPEKPLVDGIVNFLEKNNIKVFGPNKIASQLEGSKIFTKKLCEKYKIPTAKFGIFENSKEANDYLEKTKFPLVVKADGLASGKGILGLQGPHKFKKTTITGENAGISKRLETEAKRIRKVSNHHFPTITMDDDIHEKAKDIKLYQSNIFNKFAPLSKDISKECFSWTFIQKK